MYIDLLEDIDELNDCKFTSERYRRQSRLMSLVAGVNANAGREELNYHSDTPPSNSNDYRLPNSNSTKV